MLKAEFFFIFQNYVSSFDIGGRRCIARIRNYLNFYLEESNAFLCCDFWCCALTNHCGFATTELDVLVKDAQCSELHHLHTLEIVYVFCRVWKVYFCHFL